VNLAVQIVTDRMLDYGLGKYRAVCLIEIWVNAEYLPQGAAKRLPPFLSGRVRIDYRGSVLTNEFQFLCKNNQVHADVQWLSVRSLAC